MFSLFCASGYHSSYRDKWYNDLSYPNDGISYTGYPSVYLVSGYRPPFDLGLSPLAAGRSSYFGRYYQCYNIDDDGYLHLSDYVWMSYPKWDQLGLSLYAGVQVNNITGILSVRLYACVSTGSATMYSYDFYAYRELGLSHMLRVES